MNIKFYLLSQEFFVVHEVAPTYFGDDFCRHRGAFAVIMWPIILRMRNLPNFYVNLIILLFLEKKLIFWFHLIFVDLNSFGPTVHSFGPTVHSFGPTVYVNLFYVSDLRSS